MPDAKGRIVKGDKFPPATVEKMRKSKIGNKNSIKLKTIDLKQQAYDQYCAHIASGKVKDSWCFEHPELTLTSETMDKYIAEDPIIFDPIKKKVAQTKSLKYWESVLDNGATLKQKVDTACVQIVMRNKFGWDKERNVLQTSKPACESILSELKRQNVD